MTDARASDMLIAIWSFCEPEDREAFVSYLAISGYLDNFPSADSANMEPDDVDRSAERASSAVEVGATNSPEGATRRLDGIGPVQDGLKMSTNGQLSHGLNTCDAERPAHGGVTAGETAFNSNSRPVATDQNADATAADKAVADPQVPRPSATAEVSSSEAPPPPGVTEKAEAPFSSQDASAALHCPAIQAGADGHPSEPTPDALVAGQGAMPGSVAKSGEAVTTSKPGCLSPDHCRIKFQTSALCWKCRDAQTKARAA